MSMGGQKVVVIQDASRDVSWSAIRWILHGFSLKAGDELTLLAVLHQVNNPSTSSLMGAGKFLGFKSKVDSGFFGANQKFVEEEVTRKSDEYHKNEDMVQLAHQCKMQKIKFLVEVKAWPSPKVVAVEVAKEFKASWVILDRQMKKDKKYFLEKLSCGISRMKRDNTIEKLRGPKAIENTKLAAGKSSTSYVTYDEMILELKEKVSPNKSPSTQKNPSDTEQGGDESGGPPCENHQKLPLSKSSSSDHMLTIAVSSSSEGNTVQEEEITTKTEQEMAGEQSPSSSPDVKERGQTEENNTGSPDELEQHIREGDWMGEFESDNVLENSICSVCKNRRPKVGWTKEFTYAELHAATEGFSPKKFLSEGGFGSVYRGELKNGLKIAVKQHKDASFQGEREFKSEVNVLSKARHKNLVMLLGSCSEGSRRLLVYEFVCNGALDQRLSKEDTKELLNWDNRIKIALGAARGLKYLHKNNIIHRDVRPNNILVTHDHESLLGDFGLARTQFEDSEGSENKVVGTLGYMAPEYAESGKVSTKTDVYSFGVVLLQLITGRRTTDMINGGKSLIGWARPLLKEKNYPDLIDQRILDSHDMHQLFWMVRAAEKCLSRDPRKRWTMKNVVDALEYIIDGNTICTLRDFSPPESDSINSVMDSPGSQSNAGKYEEEKPSTRESITDATSERTSRVSTSSSGHSNQFGGRNQERRKGVAMSNSELLYNEMLN